MITTQKVSEYWDQRPCNIRHSTAKIGTKRYFDEVERRRYFVEPHIPQFAEFSRWKSSFQLVKITFWLAFTDNRSNYLI